MDAEEKGEKSKQDSSDLVVAVQSNSSALPQLVERVSWYEMVSLFKKLDQTKFTPKGNKESSLKLLVSKNVVRPQGLFTHPPDNTTSPFVPLIKVKPNAVYPLNGKL